MALRSSAPRLVERISGILPLRPSPPYRRFLDKETAWQRNTGYALLVAHVVAALTYLWWLAFQINWGVWYVAGPFYVAEWFAFLATTTFALTIRHRRYHRAEGLELAGPPPSLDVWITTRKEPLDILEPTIAAAVAIDYPGKHVYVLDDADREPVMELALRYGCTFLGRERHDDAKAGNMNHALSRTSGELILALDADQVPDAELMEAVVGYFRVPSIAFVQTAQRFTLPPGDPFGNADTLFYHVIQNAKDNDNAAFSCGSGVVYRREAIESIGGFSTWNLVEDVHTSMRLHAGQWRSVYHHYPLTTGTAPADIVGYVKQRSQWAVDSLRLFFWDNPMRHRGMTLSQRLQYFYTGAGYVIAGLIIPLYFIVPIWSTLSGIALTRNSALAYGLYRGIYALCTFLALGALQRPIRGFKGYRFWAGAFPIFFRAIFIALRARHSKPGYHVTHKQYASPGLALRLRHVWVQLLVLTLLVVTVPYGWWRHTLPRDAMIVNSIWSLWVFWTLSGIVKAALQSEPPVAAL